MPKNCFARDCSNLALSDSLYCATHTQKAQRQQEQQQMQQQMQQQQQQ